MQGQTLEVSPEMMEAWQTKGALIIRYVERLMQYVIHTQRYMYAYYHYFTSDFYNNKLLLAA